jgi:hypothetical protein
MLFGDCNTLERFNLEQFTSHQGSVNIMTPARIYKILLNLYPRAFRDQYGEEMTRVFQENLASEGSSFKLWIQAFVDVLSSASREHVQGGVMSLLNKLAGISSIVIGVWQVVFLSNILLNAPIIGVSNLQVIFHVLLFVLVFVGLLVRPAEERSRIWWFTVITFAALVPLNLIAYFAAKTVLGEWLGLNSSYIFMAFVCLNFVKLEQTRLVFAPEFWGLVLLTFGTLMQRFSYPIIFDPQSGQLDMILGTFAFITGWFVLGLALWSRASTPQPRALT